MATPGSLLIPSFRYNDAHAAIGWLERVLGFTRHALYAGDGGIVEHAQLTLGGGMIMLGSSSRENPLPQHMTHPVEAGKRATSATYVVAADCRAIYARAQAEGAQILSELKTMDYGGQAFTLADPEGYIWSVGEYDPWGGEGIQVAMPEIKQNPYAEALGNLDPIEVMGRTPARIAELLNQFSPEAIEAKPAPDKWSLREMMCHMADCEVAWAWRLRLIYEHDHPQLQPFDQDAWAKVYSKYKLQQARITFDSLRVWNLQFISALTEEDRKRPARHPERGEIMLWNIVETIAGHDLHHIAALEKLAKKS